MRRVQGNSSESAIYALNLVTGKNRAVGRSPGQIPFAAVDSVGLVYAVMGSAHNRIVFVPFKQVAEAVS